MTTAKLDIRKPWVDSEDSRYAFRVALSKWACQWVADIAKPIAQYAEELYDDKALRALVMRWEELSERGRETRLRDFMAASEGHDTDLDPNTWEREAGQLSQAITCHVGLPFSSADSPIAVCVDVLTGKVSVFVSKSRMPPAY